VRKLFIGQIVLVLATACIWGLVEAKAVPSVLYGGISCILPNLFFAFFFFSRKHTRRPGQILIAFYIGEFAKMFVSALIIIFAIRHLHAMVIPTVAGFFIANMIFWMAPALVLKKQQMRTT
jgi:ATP synthase protein I